MSQHASGSFYTSRQPPDQGTSERSPTATTREEDEEEDDAEERHPPGVSAIDSYGGLPADTPLWLKSVKLRKTALLRQKVRRLQSAYPMMDQPLIGMYAPGVRRPRGEGFENTPEWFRDHYQDDINDFDGGTVDLDENRPMEQFGLLQRAMVDGFDRLPSSKTDILKTAQRLTILGVVIEGLHLLLYIKLFTGVSYVQYPQYQGRVEFGMFRFEVMGETGALTDDQFKNRVAGGNQKGQPFHNCQQIRRFIDDLQIQYLLISFVLGTTTGFIDLIMLMVALIMRKRKFGLRLAIVLFSLVQFYCCLAAYILLSNFYTVNPFNEVQLGQDFALYWFMLMLIGLLCMVNVTTLLILPF